ncbi:MAG: hypothetical protein KJP25_03440 [Gammaproteobacteria bacterium]|nr:hypothetical protein [Gammaproteobacteria bacterium]NND39340.1 hypothetical protein [Pseudomonadales bacterium]NNL11425.1 hypothetical protein [Pseudomonadales bacterium]NNM12058.1 hypothetical protein [Pseudomonadales bacterium]
MSLKKILLCCALAVLVSGCSKSSGVGTGGDVGGGGSGTDTGSGGGGITTGSGGSGALELNEDNIRGSIEDVAQRLNMIAAEVMRALKPYLYTRGPEDVTETVGETDTLDPLDPVLPYGFTAANGFGALDVDQFFANANTNPLPLDPFDLAGCQVEADTNGNLDGVYAVEFRDPDFSDTLTPGDQMVFSYNVEGCDFSGDTNYERVPNELAGIMVVTFAAGTDVNSDPRRMVGTVSFNGYEYQNGLLAWREGDSETISSGSTDFDITFSPVLTALAAPDNRAALADVSNIVLTNGSFVLQDGGELLAGPLVLTYDTVSRVVHAAGDANPFDPPNPYGLGDYNLTLDNVEVVTQGDGTSVAFSTVGYPDPAVDPSIAGVYHSYPQSGAISIVGGASSEGLVPAQPDAGRLTIAQVDADGDGVYELFRPTSWDFLLGQFLVPGLEYFVDDADDS